MKKLSISIMVVIMIIPISIINCRSENKYKLLGSKDLDTVFARRTQYNIQVQTEMNDEEIKETLYQAVNELRKKREVDALALRLFLPDTSRPYAIAYWAPEGDWGKADSKKPKSIFKTSITIYSKNRPKESSKVEKFGLSSELRKNIYKEISKSQDKTLQIATKKHPSDTMKKYEYMEKLNRQYEKEICKKYNITEDQKRSILGEGVLNNWPD